MTWSEILVELGRKVLMALIKVVLFAVWCITTCAEILLREWNRGVRTFLLGKRK